MSKKKFRNRGGRPRGRRGYLYVTVLFTTLIVATITATGLTLQTRQFAAHRTGQDWIQARALADSAVAFALETINANPSWRSSYSHGQVSQPIAVGEGTISFSLHDDLDNNLSDNATENIRIRGIGTVRQTRYVTSVAAEPFGSGVECLDYTVAVNTGLVEGDELHWSTDGRFGFNGSLFTVSDFILTGDVEHRFFRWVTHIFGNVSTRSSNIQMPPANWKEYYLREGTAIDINALPFSGGARRMERCVLSTTHNPWGEANSLGIYVIDCNNQTLNIRNCRIEGTLLLINPNYWSSVTESVFWNPAISGLPALLVDGDIFLATSESPLSEAVLNTNFNPVGATPESDADLLDSYPSRIRGLVYVSLNAGVGASNTRFVIQGALVCGGLTVNGDLSATKVPGMRDNAPPGFRSGSTMQIIEGTWRREH